ncbi:hypothetical protein SBA5_450087 [Candidatus Sulfotelmatomonas gaucii]|uniref:Uncharacterized protein n=1 Tax=Candidatus Sulfuritelmatomonas gaucii TaxID=2043161 RepID=A0A2N9LMI1_9BACT|nr:hypothetical protein SBA5_450087 [Candidatus Sulfotelmatomonas gaucii]
MHPQAAYKKQEQADRAGHTGQQISIMGARGGGTHGPIISVPQMTQMQGLRELAGDPRRS